MEGGKGRASPSLGLIVVLAIILGFAGGVAGGLLTGAFKERMGGPPILRPRAGSLTPSPSLQGGGAGPASFADIAAAVIPSVVNIDTVNETPDREEQELFRRLLPFPAPVPREREGIGSGVIIRPDGIILTNEHVIKDAKGIRVTLSDGRKFTGRVLGKDRELDVAVIKIDASNLPAAKLGDSSLLRPGDWALAVGSPLGLSSSVALGVISALGRPIHISDRTYTNLIQTDAAISPGNSGGPLVNSAGEVVGMNTAIQIDMSRAVMGAAATRIGFAVPINPVKEIAEELIHTGKVVRPWVGVTMRMITEEDVKRWKLPQKEGIIIVEVAEDSPAKGAGLFRGDIILKVDGKPAKKTEEVQQQVRSHKVGDVVTFEVKRESAGGFWRTQEVKVTTAQMPENPATAFAEPKEE